MTLAIPARPRSVAIVGNAPGLAPGAAARIDAADWVVRFNNAAGFGAEAGSRVTHLALVNHGGQMREWLADPAFARRAHVRAAGRILFPFGRKAPGENLDGEDGRDWSAEAEAALVEAGGRVEVLTEDARRAALQALAERGAAPEAPPSTGFLVAHHLVRLRETREARFDVHGFGFEGWSGHAWDAERRWFEEMATGDGRFRLHLPDAATASR